MVISGQWEVDEGCVQWNPAKVEEIWLPAGLEPETAISAGQQFMQLSYQAPRL